MQLAYRQPCPAATSVEANAHEITADWVASLHIANPEAALHLWGVGVLFNEPTSGQSDTTSDTKAVYLYGAGLDLGLIPHLGVRSGAYRGNLYKAPNLSELFGVNWQIYAYCGNRWRSEHIFAFSGLGIDAPGVFEDQACAAHLMSASTPVQRHRER